MPNGALQRAADKAYREWGKSRSAKRRRKQERLIAKVRRRPNRPNWLRADGSVDYYAYVKSKAWEKRKARYFSRHERKCVECWATIGVQLHHKNYKRLGRELDSDLEPRCGGCHCNHHESDGKAIDPMTREFLSLDL